MIPLILLLFAINIYTLMRLYRIKKNATHLYGTLTENQELNFYKINFSTSLNNDGVRLENVLLQDSLGKKQSLQSIFNKGQKQILVCRFSEFHCESCVDFSIQLLLSTNVFLGKNNLLFLGSYQNNRIFNREKELFGINQFSTYNTPTLNISLEEIGYPYFFILEENLTISNIIIPDKNMPTLTQKYIEVIGNRYFNNHK